jgi:hypothetical protein
VDPKRKEGIYTRTAINEFVHRYYKLKFIHENFFHA